MLEEIMYHLKLNIKSIFSGNGPDLLKMLRQEKENVPPLNVNYLLLM